METNYMSSTVIILTGLSTSTSFSKLSLLLSSRTEKKTYLHKYS